MGLGYLGLGDKDKAVENFEKVLSIDMNHQNALHYLQISRG
jgi:Tfp pilus assembly protein PilF